MSLLRRLRQGRAQQEVASTEASDWRSGEEWWDWPDLANVVVGESRRAPDLERAFRAARCGDDVNRAVEVILEREPENPHDANAIKVSVALSRGEAVEAGYIAREVAADWGPAMDSARVRSFSCCGLIRGWNGRYGVFFWPRRVLGVAAEESAAQHFTLTLPSERLADWPRR